MVGRVQRDPGKAENNRRKHGVSFEEAQTIFFDPLLVSVEDHERSAGESRFFAIGQTAQGTLLAVSYTIRKDEAWLISARAPEPAERKRYMRGGKIRDEAPAPECDTDKLNWSNAVRGRHYIQPRGPITVTIDPVLAEFFRDERAVNDALRLLIHEGRVGMWSRD